MWSYEGLMQLCWVDVMRLDGCGAACGYSVVETQTWRQIDAVVVDLRKVKGLLYLLTHLSPRMCLDLGKFELSVVGVHLTDLLSGWGAENLERTGTDGTQLAIRS